VIHIHAVIRNERFRLFYYASLIELILQPRLISYYITLFPRHAKSVVHELFNFETTFEGHILSKLKLNANNLNCFKVMNLTQIT